jgi:DNA-binding MarR family transcriptional regulator
MESRRLQHDDHEQALEAFLLVANLLRERIDRELQRGSGIPLAYFQILDCLSRAPERTLRMSDLASHLHASRSRLSHSITRLEERGWVERASCPTDKRGTLATLTERGLSALETASPSLVQSALQHLFAQLAPAEVQQLRALSESLAAHLFSLEDEHPLD